VIGAGTVLTEAQVEQVRAVGGTMIISPNANTRVIAASAEAGLVSLPGVVTPTEAFAAIEAGATALKLFPAEGSSPASSRRCARCCPRTCACSPVGGIAPDNMGPWRDAGANGFGLGSALYKPGLTAAEVGERARAFVSALAS
jgi:2-dehydro-3-deoxyphosphogalactonate aldolase